MAGKSDRRRRTCVVIGLNRDQVVDILRWFVVTNRNSKQARFVKHKITIRCQRDALVAHTVIYDHRSWMECRSSLCESSVNLSSGTVRRLLDNWRDPQCHRH